MKSPVDIARLVFAVLFVVLGVRAAETKEPKEPGAVKAPAAPPLSPRFKQVRDRIDALFHNRYETPPPPDARLNPFRPPGAVVAAPAPSPGGRDAPVVQVVAPKPVLDDTALLQASVATLKISGNFEKGGRSYLVIIGKPSAAKDVVQTQVQGETVYLRIRQITRDSVTLVLNEAETTLKY